MIHLLICQVIPTKMSLNDRKSITKIYTITEPSNKRMGIESVLRKILRFRRKTKKNRWDNDMKRICTNASLSVCGMLIGLRCACGLSTHVARIYLCFVQRVGVFCLTSSTNTSVSPAQSADLFLNTIDSGSSCHLHTQTQEFK